jgi:hypothetical protein
MTSPPTKIGIELELYNRILTRLRTIDGIDPYYFDFKNNLGTSFLSVEQVDHFPYICLGEFVIGNSAPTPRNKFEYSITVDIWAYTESELDPMGSALKALSDLRISFGNEESFDDILTKPSFGASCGASGTVGVSIFTISGSLEYILI